MQQLAFPFQTTTSYRPEDFLVSDCNRKAWMWMQPGQDWPKPVFLLRGPKASGKSHLASIWANQHGAPIFSASGLDISRRPEDYFQKGHLLVLEDIEALSKPEEQSFLFHLFNYATQHQASLLLTVDDAACWEGFPLPDLRSRLQATAQAHILQPDDMLLAALLIKQLSDRQLSWNENLIAYLLPRLERSFAAVKQIVEQLDAAALQHKQAITPTLARQLLQQNNNKSW